MDYFNHFDFVDEARESLNLSDKDVQRIHQKHKEYASVMYAIPVTVWMPPRPYKPIRVNSHTHRIYVPEKAKMVATIRDLIMQELGPDCFLNGFFPRYSEVILQSSLYIKTPDNFSKEAKLLAEEKILRPIVTPDLDNCEKIINDSVKSFLFYDDAQIVSNITEKYYSLKPRMEIVVYYNASPLEIVHPATMRQRMERWNEMLKNPQDKPLPVLQHLRRYFHS